GRRARLRAAAGGPRWGLLARYGPGVGPAHGARAPVVGHRRSSGGSPRRRARRPWRAVLLGDPGLGRLRGRHPELATWFGDDIAFRADSRRVDLAGLPMLGFMLRHVGVGTPALHRIRLGAKLVATGGKGVEQVLLSHCLTTARMAERLGLGADVCDPLQQVFTRWDGKGVPSGVGGDAIAFPMRLLQLADIVEVFHRIDGTDSAVEVARARRGKQFDPAVVDAFCGVAPDVLGDASSDLDWEAL